MEAINQLTSRALIAMKEQQTPEKPVNIEAWAKWAGFQIAGTHDETVQLNEMISGCAKFCRAVKEKQKPFWLSLIGGSGGGKTFLAKRIWKWFQTTEQFKPQVDRDWDGRDEITYPGQFCWWPEISNELSSNRGYDRVNELMREKFVVLDEIGADRDPNGHTKDHLARILCSRVGKWTVITSNKTLEDIASGIDTRVASRMIRDGSIVVEIDVRDYWIRK